AYDRPHGEWYIFELTIERQQPKIPSFKGIIRAHVWRGGEHDALPKPCDANGSEHVIRMPARGQLRGTRLDFGSKSFVVESVPCGGVGGYNPDSMHGTLNAADGTYAAIDDDPRGLSIPVFYRRARCLAPNSRGL